MFLSFFIRLSGFGASLIFLWCWVHSLTILRRKRKTDNVLRILWLSGWEITTPFSVLSCSGQLIYIYVFLTYIHISLLASNFFRSLSLLFFLSPASLPIPQIPLLSSSLFLTLHPLAPYLWWSNDYGLFCRVSIGITCAAQAIIVIIFNF